MGWERRLGKVRIQLLPFGGVDSDAALLRFELSQCCPSIQAASVFQSRTYIRDLASVHSGTLAPRYARVGSLDKLYTLLKVRLSRLNPT